MPYIAEWFKMTALAAFVGLLTSHWLGDRDAAMVATLAAYLLLVRAS